MFNHRVNKNFSTPATKFPLSQAISYTFLDKHFLLIENMSSEASSSESFILLLFFQRSQNPFFQKSHFSKKSAPFFPLFSPILSTTRFCFYTILCRFYPPKPKQFLIFFTSDFTQFRTIYRNMIFGSSRSTILTIGTITNPSKFLHKLHLNLCTKLLPEKCINSTYHAIKRFYLHNQSCKIIITYTL